MSRRARDFLGVSEIAEMTLFLSVLFQLFINYPENNSYNCLVTQRYVWPRFKFIRRWNDVAGNKVGAYDDDYAVCVTGPIVFR